jgi:hypothetical protein
MEFIWFKDAYSLGALSSLAKLEAGYFQTFPRLVAALGLLLPLAYVPLSFNLVASVVQILPVLILLSDRGTRVSESYLLRMLICALYLTLPGTAELHA